MVFRQFLSVLQKMMLFVVVSVFDQIENCLGSDYLILFFMLFQVMKLFMLLWLFGVGYIDRVVLIQGWFVVQVIWNGLQFMQMWFVGIQNRLVCGEQLVGCWFLVLRVVGQMLVVFLFLLFCVVENFVIIVGWLQVLEFLFILMFVVQFIIGLYFLVISNLLDLWFSVQVRLLWLKWVRSLWFCLLICWLVRIILLMLLKFYLLCGVI